MGSNFTNISRMSASKQKLLWIQLNKNKLTTLAKQLDNTVAAHHLSTADIDQLINEAKKNGKKKKG